MDEDYITDSLSTTDIPEETADVATQTEEKHCNRRYIQAGLPKKFGETAPRSKLPREIWKWLLGLSLKNKIKNVSRDFSNGYAIAEVLKHYYPQVNEDMIVYNRINVL